MATWKYAVEKPQKRRIESKSKLNGMKATGDKPTLHWAPVYVEYIKWKIFEVLFNQYLRSTFVSICIAYAYAFHSIRFDFARTICEISTCESISINWLKINSCHFMHYCNRFLNFPSHSQYYNNKQESKTSPITPAAMCARCDERWSTF